jgi:hypothetical protein
LASVPVEVPMIPLTLMSPSPSNVRFMPDPPMAPDKVNVPASDCNSAAAVAVSAPEIVLAPLTLRITPVDEVPVPAIDIASGSEIEPLIWSSAPDETDVEPPDVPNDPELVARTIPVEIVVDPV